MCDPSDFILRKLNIIIMGMDNLIFFYPICKFGGIEVSLYILSGKGHRKLRL